MMNWIWCACVCLLVCLCARVWESVCVCVSVYTAKAKSFKSSVPRCKWDWNENMKTNMKRYQALSEYMDKYQATLMYNAQLSHQRNERQKYRQNQWQKRRQKTLASCSSRSIEYYMATQYQHAPILYTSVWYSCMRTLRFYTFGMWCVSLLVGLYTERTNRMLFSRMDCIGCLGKKFYMAT